MFEKKYMSIAIYLQEIINILTSVDNYEESINKKTLRALSTPQSTL